MSQKSTASFDSESEKEESYEEWNRKFNAEHEANHLTFWKKSIRIPTQKKSSSRNDSPKKPSSEPHLSTEGSLALWKYRKKFIINRRSIQKKFVSWKFRKKKSVFDRSSILKESASWKRQKKKCPKFIYGSNSLHLKERASWKRRKKKPSFTSSSLVHGIRI